MAGDAAAAWANAVPVPAGDTVSSGGSLSEACGSAITAEISSPNFIDEYVESVLWFYSGPDAGTVYVYGQGIMGTGCLGLGNPSTTTSTWN
jgi:hypothetical protein